MNTTCICSFLALNNELQAPLLVLSFGFVPSLAIKVRIPLEAFAEISTCTPVVMYGGYQQDEEVKLETLKNIIYRSIHGTAAVCLCERYFKTHAHIYIFHSFL